MNIRKTVLFAAFTLLAVFFSCGTSSRDMGMRNEADIAFEWISYTVQEGDTIVKIAEQFGVSLDVVIICNDIHNAWNL